ncbi:hypothetical protein JCM18237_24170 [Halorubrum luteum]
MCYSSTPYSLKACPKAEVKPSVPGRLTSVSLTFGVQFRFGGRDSDERSRVPSVTRVHVERLVIRMSGQVRILHVDDAPDFADLTDRVRTVSRYASTSTSCISG